MVIIFLQYITYSICLLFKKEQERKKERKVQHKIVESYDLWETKQKQGKKKKPINKFIIDWLN